MHSAEAGYPDQTLGLEHGSRAGRRRVVWGAVMEEPI